MTKCAVLMLLPETYKRQTAAMADRHMRRSAYWKAGESVNMLTRRFAFVPPYIGRMAKNFRADFELFMEKKKISFPFK